MEGSVGKRRSWRKLHLGVDPNTHEIVAAELTTLEIPDGQVLPDLLQQVDGHPTGTVIADGAYDNHRDYEAILEQGGQPVIPPKRGAVAWGDDHPRTAAVTQCATTEGSNTLQARNFLTQQVEVHAAIAVLNRMAALGLPIRA